MLTQTTAPRTMPRRSSLHARPGFSLIELTAVLVILGLLMAGAAIAVPKQIEKARIKTTKNSMNTIKAAIGTYMVEQAGQAPASISVLIGEYLEPGADIDAWKNAYYYIATPGGPQSYDLISAGADGQFQTTDDLNLWTMDMN